MLALHKKQIEAGRTGYSNLPAIIEKKLDIAEHHLRIDAAEHRFDIKKVGIIKMVPGPAALIALKQGEIGGISAWEPWIAEAVVEGIGHLKRARAYAKVMPQYGLTRGDTSERIPEAADFGLLEAAAGKRRLELGFE